VQSHDRSGFVRLIGSNAAERNSVLHTGALQGRGYGFCDRVLMRAKVRARGVRRDHDVHALCAGEGVGQRFPIGEIGGYRFRAFLGERIQMPHVPADCPDFFPSG
jgi:hypothetical protein